MRNLVSISFSLVVVLLLIVESFAMCDLVTHVHGFPMHSSFGILLLVGRKITLLYKD